MASSLALPQASTLAGKWQLRDESSVVSIALDDTPDKAANGFKLQDPANKLSGLLKTPTVAWRPAPDGIALLDKDGYTVVFLGNQGNGLYAQHGSKLQMTPEK